MAWANFAHLTKFETDGIGISGKGKTAQSTGAPGPRLKPLPMESAAGGPAAKPTEEVSRFLTAQKAAVRRYKINPELRTRPWFNKAIKNANGKIDAFVNAVTKQLEQAVNEQSITEAQYALNEVSRTAEGAAAVRKVATKANLLRLINVSKGRA